MGVDFADYDNDGWPDIVVDDLANQRYALYQNNKDGTFNYASAESGVGAMTLLHSGWGLRFLDYDNDGWKDLLVAQGHDLDTVERINPQFHYREPMLLARNLGQKFVDVSSMSGAIFHEAWVGRGMAIGDIDNDGRIDAVVTTNGGPAHVLLNETEHAGHWLTLRLIGHKSNRDGIGAVVEAKTAGGKQWATVTTASGYLSSSDPRVHFGLGESSAAACIEVRWPSGIVQTLTDIKGDRQVQVDEPEKSTSNRCD
jgi:enediyne biosynthesis protein E4